MAGEKIPQAGEPIICAEVEDLLATLPAIGEATDAITRRVVICDLCGRGFLTISEGADNLPLWWVGENGPQGGICGGAIRTISLRSAMKAADNYEQIGGEAWLRGQRKL
jgi:hypothetical protein